MSLRTLFSHTPKHWKNGTTWFGRTFCWIIGEHYYDALRVYKRTFYAEWWINKQGFLNWFYQEHVDAANFFSVLPKPDSSHGFPWRETPSRYAELAEDNFNSDGFAGWYTYTWVGAAAIWGFYIYFMPRRFLASSDFAADDEIHRITMNDAVMSSNYDNSWTYWWDHWQKLVTPHRWHWFRQQAATHFAPDSKIQGLTVTLNARNHAYDHYWRGIGERKSMI